MTQSFLPTQKSETESFIRFNRSILRHSGLRVILMCGRAVPGLVLPKEREETRLKLEAEWRKSHRISEVLRFTSAITRTTNIHPYAGDNGSVLTKVIRDCMNEWKGIQEPLTLKTLHPMTRLWLTLRGFATDE
ncbi:uncharacterized protein N7529_007938 [Penicillium soppii]|uniref:uncharacterized protein n=1 Tax=Penicillium soppii TaxID=69789 RepID=UPI002549B9F1|nr:uncharacterized protein N7529_007938 [Penicillium soppii]KAJ5860628.1 hypothetical protein N7529_007938 [Penicillium soppii]